LVCSTDTKEALHAAFLGSMGLLSFELKELTSSHLGLDSPFVPIGS
jgi:hypothetical protein